MTGLSRVCIATSDLPRAVTVYEAITGIHARETASGFEFPLGDAHLELRPATGTVGLVSIILTEPSLLTRQRALIGAGVTADSSPERIRIPAEAASGIAVQIMEAHPAGESPARARLDHVALRVRDLAAASHAWEAITGVGALAMGVHPVSGGSFEAVRFPLGERMIELISPVPGVDSPVAARLASHGEGVAALALPVEDIDAARERLERIGVRVLRREPHWMVHPQDAGGVLVQLTPRIEH